MNNYAVDITKEEFELVTVFGHPMLFTNLRCDRSTLPKGLFMYEVRHDDDCLGIPCEIARSILVNHWGTIISNKPVLMEDHPTNGKPYRHINEETDWNYEGITCDLREYMRKYPPQKEKNYER